LSPGKQDEQKSPDEQIDQQDKDWLHDLQGTYGDDVCDLTRLHSAGRGQERWHCPYPAGFFVKSYNHRAGSETRLQSTCILPVPAGDGVTRIAAQFLEVITLRKDLAVSTTFT
jgi:hypothetical protein